MMLVNRFSEFNLIIPAEKFRQKYEEIKSFLIQNQWTDENMSQKWLIGNYGIQMYGQITGKSLIYTNGVKIYDDFVRIAYFNGRGYETKPFIYCDNSEFKIVYE